MILQSILEKENNFLKTYTLKKEQKISKNILDVFDFFSKPENLSIITPRKMGFKILTPNPIEMKDGAIIDYSIKILGIPVRWTTIIVKYSPPHLFVDQQLKGPYSFWHHTHTFKKINENETLIQDVVLYAIPFNFIGSIVHSLYIKRDLKNIFLYRAKKNKEIFS